MNPTIAADLPRKAVPPSPPKLPASQRCVGLMNGEASIPGKGTASDITGYYMAFVMADGTVRMAGINTNFQLGRGNADYDPQHLHHLVWDNRAASSLAAAGRPRYVVGGFATAAMLTDAGDVVVWGYNGQGQQGRGHTTGNGYAQRVIATHIGRASGIPGRDVVKIDLTRSYLGGKICLYALARDGSLWAWGYGTRGALAQGNTNHAYRPVRCKKTGNVPLEDIVDVWPGHGDGNACFALTRDGKLWAVGDNDSGKLGVGDTTNRTLFTEVAGLPATSRVKKVVPCGSLRSGATAVLMRDGSIWTAGDGAYGFHGRGGTADRLSFAQLPLPSGVRAATHLRGGGEYAQAWFNGDDGNTYACGRNDRGQLGVGSTSNILVPRRVRLPAGVTARMISTGGGYISSSSVHAHSTIMLGSNRRVYTCGYQGGYGAWGVSSPVTTPAEWPLPMAPADWDPVEVAAHGPTSAIGFFVRLASGTVWAAGYNIHNKLGVEGGGFLYPNVPARVELY